MEDDPVQPQTGKSPASESTRLRSRDTPDTRLRLGTRFVEELPVANFVQAVKDALEIVEPKPTIREEVFSNIQDSLGEIRDYYKINKQQARSSFRVSVAAIGCGLITLVVGILLFYKYGSAG